MTLQSIMSAGQKGAESAALEAATTLGLLAWGTVPKGWHKGATEVYATNMVAHNGNAYPPCIECNVKAADGTLIVGKTDGPPGSLSLRACNIHQKPWIANPTGHQLVEWAAENNVKTLHVSGSKTSDLYPDIETTTFAILLEAFGGL